ncbi:MAG: HAD family hydrolase [bacterium]|nr:HAD family hydrolase [bacterium]
MSAASDSGAGPRLVILDRDGVINADSDDYIKSPAEFQFLPGSLEAILRLKRAGKLLAIATNQSGLARGYFDEATLQAMHAKLLGALAAKANDEPDTPGHQDGRGAASEWIDRIVYCPHGPDEGCACRKPLPGMLLEILKRFDVAPREAVFIGDSLSDIQAGQAAGVAPLLVRTGKGQRTLARRESSTEAREILAGVPVFRDLAAAAFDLLSISVDDLDG